MLPGFTTGGELMKAYVQTTGVLFALIALAHIARMSAERHLARDPLYLLLTAVAVLLCFWSWRVLRVGRP